MQKYPQVLINVRVAEGVDRSELKTLKDIPEIKAAIEQAERKLEAAGGGRVLIRPSGTEPLIRVMVEAYTDADAQKHAADLAELLKQRFGADAG
jgi:phosphoglucosamine mutase